MEAERDIIKSNRAELEEYKGINGDITAENIKKTVDSLLNKGIHTVAVSMGKDGAVFAKKNMQ